MRAIFPALIMGAGLAMPAAAQTITGHYAVEGTSPNGSTYTGTADITQTSDTDCRIAWHYDGSESNGICMVSGNVFAGAYPSGDNTGLLIYHLAADGTLSGMWTEGSWAVGTETLTPFR